MPICEEDENDEITLAITPADTSAFILAPRIQKISDYILHAIRSRILRFIASLFIFFFGFATIVYTMFALKTERENKTAFHFCLYAQPDDCFNLYCNYRSCDLRKGRKTFNRLGKVNPFKLFYLHFYYADSGVA